MEEKELFENEFDRLYGNSYREGKSDATNSDHKLPGNAATDEAGQSSTTVTAADDAVKALVRDVAPKELDKEQPLWFGYDVHDFVNAMYPNGPNSRHDASRDLFNDLLVMFDADYERARRVLMTFSFVQEIIVERGIDEIDRIVEGGRKLLQKRESENFNAPQPSKEMRRAIEQVTGRKYAVLVREARSQALGQAAGLQQEILTTLERIGSEFDKLKSHYPLMKLLFFRMKPKYFPAVFFVGGAFSMTLMTRCWYHFWPKPGRKCRLNSLVMLIGRMGGLKSVAVDLYEMMMEPVRKSDAAQIAALNNFPYSRRR